MGNSLGTGGGWMGGSPRKGGRLDGGRGNPGRPAERERLGLRRGEEPGSGTDCPLAS